MTRKKLPTIYIIDLKEEDQDKGYGQLCNIKVDDSSISSDDCIENYLGFEDEEPKVVVNNCISDMTEKHRNYRKISIKNN